MADARTKIRRWGADWHQLMAERALVEAEGVEDNIDAAFQRMVEVDRLRQQFRDRTHQPEPPRWE
jgi:hypothetical protein